MKEIDKTTAGVQTLMYLSGMLIGLHVGEVLTAQDYQEAMRLQGSPPEGEVDKVTPGGQIEGGGLEVDNVTQLQGRDTSSEIFKAHQLWVFQPWGLSYPCLAGTEHNFTRYKYQLSYHFLKYAYSGYP